MLPPQKLPAEMRSGSDSDLGSDVKEAATSSTCSDSDCAANAEEETVGSRRRLRKSADVETDTEDEEVPSSAQQLEERRLENVKALVSGRYALPSQQQEQCKLCCGTAF